MEFMLNAAAAPGAKDAVKDTDTAHFVADVIDASAQVPVIVDFWAPWCGPCKQLGPIIEKLVRQAAGKVKLVKVNIDENQRLAQQMRIQSIPAVYAFVGGRPVDAFVGAQPESQIKAFVDRLLGGAKSPLDEALTQADEALQSGDFDTAVQLYAAVLGEDAEHARAAAGVLRALVAKNDIAGAKAAAEQMPAPLKAKPEVLAALQAIELATESTGDAAVIAGFKARIEKDPKDHEARYELAVALYAADDKEGAIEELLELVKRGAKWNDDAGRKRLIKIFEALGFDHPLTLDSRRRLASILFS